MSRIALLVLAAAVLGGVAGARPPLSCEDYVTVHREEGVYHIVADLDRSNWDPSGMNRYVQVEAGLWAESNNVAGLQCLDGDGWRADREIAEQDTLMIVPCSNLPVYDPFNYPVWIVCDTLFPY